MQILKETQNNVIWGSYYCSSYYCYHIASCVFINSIICIINGYINKNKKNPQMVDNIHENKTDVYIFMKF